MTRLIALFTAHPGRVDESYLQHMAFAGRFAGLLFAAGAAALVHAALPFLFERTASDLIRRMHARIDGRGAPAAEAGDAAAIAAE